MAPTAFSTKHLQKNALPRHGGAVLSSHGKRMGKQVDRKSGAGFSNERQWPAWGAIDVRPDGHSPPQGSTFSLAHPRRKRFTSKPRPALPRSFDPSPIGSRGTAVGFRRKDLTAGPLWNNICGVGTAARGFAFRTFAGAENPGKTNCRYAGTSIKGVTSRAAIPILRLR
jgi:hypothetical protein